MRAAGLSVLFFLPLAAVAPAARGDDVDFTRDVRPILSRHCFKCHGPDEKARKGELRLDVREGALKGGSTGEKAIVPGKPDDSEVVRRILSDDENEVMPPPSAKLPLTAAQKEILRRWVAQGAAYVPHWAFVAPRQAPLPKVQHANWPRNPIDHFVLAKMEEAG
ncbi:MAG: c-type cytochrome domain-containing protein, partial [Deltaproteobacteria bacterium]